MDSNNRFLWITAALVFFFLSLSSGFSFAAPQPTITANNGTKRVLVMPGMQLDLSIAFGSGDEEGTSADWWLYAEIGGSYFHYELNGQWVPGFQVSAQAPLTSFSPFNVLSMAGLPAGTYNITFGVDLNMNGRLGNDAYLDTLELTVPAYSCPDTVNTQDALSDDQKAFIASRGNPDMFILGFISEEFDAENRATYLTDGDIRRIASWIYNREELTMASFDNGYFVDEKTLSAAVDDLQPVQFSPAQLSPCMGYNDIVTLLGEPSCTKTEVVSGRTYSYMRYNPSGSQPASTFVLENGALITVIAGYSLDLDSAPNDGNLCTD